MLRILKDRYWAIAGIKMFMHQEDVTYDIRKIYRACIDALILSPPSMRCIKWGITVALWLQNSPKTQIIHGISGITTQHLVQKEKPYNTNYRVRIKVIC